MAYLKTIRTRCDYSNCGKIATEALYNRQNCKYGEYCATHAKIRLKMLLDEEAKK